VEQRIAFLKNISRKEKQIKNRPSKNIEKRQKGKNANTTKQKTKTKNESFNLCF
jgi:hypothetical protein